MATMPANLPLPIATARAWLATFREYRAEMARSRNTDHYIRWRSNSHCCQLRVKELRRANPRARRKHP